MLSYSNAIIIAVTRLKIMLTLLLVSLELQSCHVRYNSRVYILLCYSSQTQHNRL